MGILRDITREERRDFLSLMDADPKRAITTLVESKFQEAMKKGLPFCRQAVWDFINDSLETQSKESQRKNGFVKAADIKMPEIEWSKFSDLKNFKLLEEGDAYTEDLSKRYGTPVYLKKKNYQWIGTVYTICVMEDGLDALKRIQNVNKTETGQTK